MIQTDHASTNARTIEKSARRVQQQSGGWAKTGNGPSHGPIFSKSPVPSEGWTPFET
jgi:hypothetical protein